MKLSELYDRIQIPEKTLSTPASEGQKDPVVRGVRYDSRNTEEGTLFACMPGERVDGHDFAAQAVAGGAVALLCERQLPFAVPQIIVPDVRAAMGEAAAVLHDRPAERLTMIGLTGTNGKTTTAYVMRAILRAAGRKAGMLGTVVYDDGASEYEADRTTPEGPDIQDLLARMIANGADSCVMEASSHGLVQGRLRGCHFDRTGFSNLTPEHLEFHRDMEGYFAAKRLLFSDYVKENWLGAINADDEYGLRLLSLFPGRLRAYSLHHKIVPEVRDALLYRAADIVVTIKGTRFELVYPDGERAHLYAPLIGDYNVSNILEAVALVESLEVDRQTIKQGLFTMPQVPGRLERIALGNGAAVFVDYAHSSDGMEKILSTLSSLKKGRLTVLWGAGGDRTAAKRPVVGELMARYADRVVITTDNPRSERPADIARDVEKGVLAAGGRDYSIILDRKEAIYRALDEARADEVVIVAGKGPESYIDYGTHREPFSDSGTVLHWAADRSVEVLEA